MANDEIYKIADEIAKRGENPTLAKVRNEMGGGSYTTISEAMKLWRENQKKKNEPKPIEIPDDVKDLGKDFIEEIYKAALLAAEETLKHKSEALDKKLEESLSRENEAVELAQQLEKEVETLNQQNSDLIAEIDLIAESKKEIENEINDNKEKYIALEATNKEHLKQMIKLEQKNTKLENELIKIAKVKIPKKE